MRQNILVLNADAFLAKAKELGVKENLKNVCGFTVKKDGKPIVVINADNSQIDTPIHEIGIHSLFTVAENTGYADLRKAILKYGAEASEEIKDYVMEKYPELEEDSDAFYEEVAANAFDVYASNRQASFANQSWFQNILQAVKDAISYIKDLFVDDNNVFSQVENMGEQEIGNRLYDMVMGGKEVIRFNDGNTVEQGINETDGLNLSEEEQSIINAAVDEMLNTAGVKVVRESEDAPVPETVQLSKKQKRVLETASVSQNEEHQPTAIPSTQGLKILNNIDNTITEYENKSNYSQTFIGDVADSLGIEMPDKKSKYARFETKSGKIVTIRLSDHNATASNFDNYNEDDGISIVISTKNNENINNDGKAHIVEFYYNAIKLRKADTKPLVEILKSIKQSLYSGEYKDTTGLAEVEEVNIPSKVQYWISNRRSTERWENSGYTYREDGTRVSNRALEAEERGTFTAGTFRKVYGLTKADFDILVDLGLINNTEWHHTGKSFRESDCFHSLQLYFLNTLKINPNNPYIGRKCTITKELLSRKRQKKH